MNLTLPPEKAVALVGDAPIGGHQLTIIAGPCAIQSRAPTFALAEAVKRSGARFFHGGILKPSGLPKTSPGLDEEGLKILAEVRELYKLKVVTEILDEQGFDLIESYVDMLQIGPRNMQNSSLLGRAGRSHLPIMIKRGIAATLDEWLLAAECIAAGGNKNIILCEGGIRTFTEHSRYSLDFSLVPAVRRISSLPIIFDPSNGTGKDYLVRPLALAAVAAASDGVIVEIHAHPEGAPCNSSQAITLDQYERLVLVMQAIHDVTSSYAGGFD